MAQQDGRCQEKWLRHFEPLSIWKLVSEDIELMNLRLFSKQIAALRLFHQGRCHLAVEVGVAPSFIVERVEYGEGGRPHLNGEPRNRSRFSVHQGEGGAQKICDLLLLARLRFQRNV